MSLKTIMKPVDAVSEWTGKLVSFLIIPIIAVIIYEVVARDFFNSPQQWVHEFSCYLFGFLFLLAGAYNLRHRWHVNVDVFTTRMSPRIRSLLNLFTALFILVYCAMIVWKGLPMTIDAYVLHFKGPTSWAPPLWPLYAAIALGSMLVMLQTVSNMIKDFYTVIRGQEL